MYRLILGVLFALSFLVSKPAFCFVSGVVDYVKQYQIGIDYANSIDTVKLTYDTDAAGGTPSSCKAVDGNAAKKECSVDMVAGGSSGFGLFLQRAFKKQGFWYFDYDLGFGARYLSGGIEKKNESLQGLPLKQAKFSLLSLVGKPYIQFGITPDRFPDILLSVGPAIQVAMGNVSINDQSEKVVTGTSSYEGPMSLWHGFFELEIVLKRFGEGAFSVFSSKDFTGSGEGTKIYPKDLDGMSNFRGAFSHSVGGAAFGFGLKLVTPFP